MALISYLTKIHFADGVLEEALAAERQVLGIRRPLIVTDQGLVESGLVERLYDALAPPAVQAVFDETPSNPTERACMAALDIYRQQECDGLVAFGGGSSMDLAKAVGLRATHDGPLAGFAAIEGGIGRIKDILPPLIAIPTTAGSGSEVGRGAIISLDDGRKVGILSPHLLPDVAICDPTLTLNLPPDLTAVSGMDALTHCIETFLSTAYNPPADGIALDGLRRAVGNIERAVDRGYDLGARREMMAAAMNGALAFQKGLGGVHAMSHALAGVSGEGLTHGTLNAVLLPHMLAFNAPAVEDRYPALRQAMGLAGHTDLAEAVTRLTERLGLPTVLSSLGVNADTARRAAPLAEKDHTNNTNPRLAVADDYEKLMLAAL
ncbi:MAG: iron-containing alcohol dehydrogenase [Pseudomonadota bacterium]